MHHNCASIILDAIHQSVVIDNTFFFFCVYHFVNERKENQNWVQNWAGKVFALGSFFHALLELV